MAQSKKTKQAFAIAQSQEERGAVRDSSKGHPGFKSVQRRVAAKTNPRTGKPYGMERAGKILAFSSRNASSSAKRRNPRLSKVKG